MGKYIVIYRQYGGFTFKTVFFNKEEEARDFCLTNMISEYFIYQLKECEVVGNV